MARIEAVVRRRRRSRPRADVGPVVAGEVEIRADQFQAFVSGRSLELTRREFELLQVLAEASGTVIEREEIYQRVWGYAMAHGDRSVDVFVRKLRAKLQKHSPGWEYIHTHFGVGYRFEPDADRRAAGRGRDRARAGPAGRGHGRRDPRRRARRPARLSARRDSALPVHTLFTRPAPRRNKLADNRCELCSSIAPEEKLVVC